MTPAKLGLLPRRLLCVTIVGCATSFALARAASPSPDSKARAPVSDTTWVDHDAQPIPQPRDWEPNFNGHMIREGIFEPLSHAFDIPDRILAGAALLGARTRREAVNANAFDEVPNSTWFTNRNHLRSVPVSQLLVGPDSTLLPAKPWTIKHAKHGGASAGFQIMDATGRKWLVKLDWHGYPQLSSGADMIARTLLHAAGYNVPHNEPIRFTRGDLKIDGDLLRGTKGERFSEVDLDSMLARGAVVADGAYSGIASLFLSGHALGPTIIDQYRPGDLNDWYSHPNRRELRGLYVVSSWLGFWDTKDANFLDVFDSTGAGLGHVEHYVLDPGSSLGAEANGPKLPEKGYENTLDFGWIARRLVTLGLVEEPWGRAHQETGIPSVGNFESEGFEPNKFVPEVPSPAFRAMTDRDANWGAKIVASFSEAQIRAAVEAAHYEDPRASDFLVRALLARRDKIARYWFGRVTPLDFFVARGGALHFRDLAVDIGLVAPRTYNLEIESGDWHGPRPQPARRHSRIGSSDLPLEELATGASRITLEVSVDKDRARPARVELVRKGADWVVTRVTHG